MYDVDGATALKLSKTYEWAGQTMLPSFYIGTALLRTPPIWLLLSLGQPPRPPSDVKAHSLTCIGADWSHPMSTCRLGIIFFILHATMHLSWSRSLAKANVNVRWTLLECWHVSIADTRYLDCKYVFGGLRIMLLNVHNVLPCVVCTLADEAANEGRKCKIYGTKNTKRSKLGTDKAP